ncbi:hypothetical protein PHYPSEUDO_002412 [Phytophthora pseudosyringae]|uniref:Uncharacterized protein n=1 Tax=Phytophthora pseudosyringae TaxID=221518 RepID=A0A8T1VTJ7_9STRA|nr:hypothetical protein PHYPSEUDO_002412 [Phytophthora pseudosyringae]
MPPPSTSEGRVLLTKAECRAPVQVPHPDEDRRAPGGGLHTVPSGSSQRIAQRGRYTAGRRQYQVNDKFGAKDAQYVVVALPCLSKWPPKVDVAHRLLLLAIVKGVVALANSAFGPPAVETSPVVVTGVYGGMFRTPPSRHGPHMVMASASRTFAVAESEELYDAALMNAASESSQMNTLNMVFGELLDLEGLVAFTKQFLF